jgi:hypothetical protein
VPDNRHDTNTGADTVQFTYTSEQLALRERASRLTGQIIPFEEPCEAGRGLAPLPEFGTGAPVEAIVHA